MHRNLGRGEAGHEESPGSKLLSFSIGFVCYQVFLADDLFQKLLFPFLKKKKYLLLTSTKENPALLSSLGKCDELPNAY